MNQLHVLRRAPNRNRSILPLVFHSLLMSLINSQMSVYIKTYDRQIFSEEKLEVSINSIILHNIDHQTRQYVQGEKHHDQIEQILLRHCHQILIYSPTVSYFT